jgi:ABC-type sugar transport system ATPase subunit
MRRRQSLTDTPSALIECRNVTKRFGSTVAVDDVSLGLVKGRATALVGENGAGKTTLMSVLSGELQPDEGTILVEGEERRFRSAMDARRAGIAIVHQELSLFPDLTVAENVALGREPTRGLSVINNSKLHTSVQETLEFIRISLNLDQLVGELSPALQQLVEIAKALHSRPRVLILDEPTSSLGTQEVEVLQDCVRRLEDQEASVVFVSHRLDEVFDFADNVCVMRDGRLVAQGPLAEYTSDALVTEMVGREITQVYPERDHPPEDRPPFLELSNVTAGFVRDLSLSVSPGSMIGIGGLEGQGQSLVAEIVAGIRQPEQGSVRVAGEEVKLRSPQDALRHGIAYVPPDRRTSGLMLPLSITKNAAVSALRRIHKLGLIRPNPERLEVSSVADQLHLRYKRLSQEVSELSGGNQQKVLFGRWLLVPSLKLLVLNDPTRGVDIGARAEIYALLRKLTEDDVCILLISTDLMELLGLADLIYVMYEGRITGSVLREQATEEEVMRLAANPDGQGS